MIKIGVLRTTLLTTASLILGSCREFQVVHMFSHGVTLLWKISLVIFEELPKFSSRFLNYVWISQIQIYQRQT